MKCLICTNPKRAEIDALLLQRNGRRVGAVMALAAKLGISRGVLWRHRKKHLGLNVSRAVDPKKLGFEGRARLLAEEADRLQRQVEAGLDRAQVNQAMKALALRVKLLQLEGMFAGKLRGGKGGHDVHGGNVDAALAEAGAVAAGDSLDPAEADAVTREYQEIVGESAP